MEVTEMIHFIKKNSEFYSDVDFAAHSDEQVKRIYHLLKFEKDNKSRSMNKELQGEVSISSPHFF